MSGSAQGRARASPGAILGPGGRPYATVPGRISCWRAMASSWRTGCLSSTPNEPRCGKRSGAASSFRRPVRGKRAKGGRRRATQHQGFALRLNRLSTTPQSPAPSRFPKSLVENRRGPPPSLAGWRQRRVKRLWIYGQARGFGFEMDACAEQRIRKIDFMVLGEVHKIGQ